MDLHATVNATEMYDFDFSSFTFALALNLNSLPLHENLFVEVGQTV